MNAEAAAGKPEAPRGRSAGAMLAAERERQGLSRADIAQRLHISVTQIEALEKSDYAQFPRGPFLKGFTRNYARALGLNADALVDLVAESSPQGDAPGIVVPSQNIRFDPLGQRLGNPYVKAAGIAAAVIVLGFAAMYWWLFVRVSPAPAASQSKPVAGAAKEERGAPAPALEAPPPAQPAPAATDSAPPVERDPPRTTPPVTSMPSQTGAPASTASGATAPAPVVAAPVVATPVVAAPPPAAARPGEGSIRLVIRGATWIEVRDASGQALVSRNQAAGTTAEVSGKPPLRVTVGNAPGVSLYYNGREVDMAPHTRDTVARLTLQ